MIEMAGQVAGQCQHRLHHWQAAVGRGEMRAWRDRDRLKPVSLRQLSQIKAMNKLRKCAGRAGSDPCHIECEPIAQKLNPQGLASPDRFHLGFGRRQRVVTEDHSWVVRSEFPDGIAIGPFASGKQQMQFRGIAMLRPNNRSVPLVRRFACTHCVAGFCKLLILWSTHQ